MFKPTKTYGVKYTKTRGVNNVIKINLIRNGAPTSVTLRKDLLGLWILLTEKSDPDVVGLITEFIYDIVLPLWKPYHGRGLSGFTHKCILRSILGKRDYKLYKNIMLLIEERS